MKTKTQYTVSELNAFKTIDEIEGKLQTGTTKATKYKVVDLAQSETFSEAVVVSYNGGQLQILDRPELRSQFLGRGC